MSFYVEAPTSKFTPVPIGMHLARLFRIVDLGTQRTEYEGNVNFKRQLQFVWEVHGKDEEGNPTVTEKGEPLIITKDYNLSWADMATLRIDLESWRGRPFTDDERRRFDIENVIGNWCMLTVIHKPKKKGSGVYANVKAVTPVSDVRKKIGFPEPHNKTSFFRVSEPDMELFETFPKYLQEKISSCPEWRGEKSVNQAQKSGGGSGFDDMDDDVPF